MESNYSNKSISRFIIFFCCTAICVSIFFPFITTVAVAAIFALVLNPFVEKLQQLKFFGRATSRKKCTALLLLGLVTMFTVPFSVMGSKIYSHVSEFSAGAEGKKEFVLKFSRYIVRMEEQLSHYITRFGLKRQINIDDVSGELVQKTANFIFDQVALGLRQVPSLLTALLIFLIALYYLLAEADKIKVFFHQLGLFSFREINVIGESLKSSSYSAVVSTILAGVVHGLIIAVGAQMAGVGDFSIVFMLTFFLSFIPVIGAALVALGLCVPALIEQNYPAALMLFGIALLASAIDNIVRPMFMVYGNSLIHPFIALLSVLGGIYVLGMAGLFIGPVLVQVTIESLPKLVRLTPNPKTKDFRKQYNVTNRTNDIRSTSH